MHRDYGKPFLTAEWRHLAMLNYEVDPALLEPFVPDGTELDAWRGRFFVSMVGFLFLRTRLLGVPIPLHRDFEEVNLRFYVRRKSKGEWRRGVVFVKEIVPRAAIAFVARHAYNENYVALPMSHSIALRRVGGEDVGSVRYAWRFARREHCIELQVKGEAASIAEGSEEEYITHHYWGYSRQKHGGTVEYRVDHPPWRVWQATESRFDCDAERLYGEAFGPCLRRNPSSAFLAEGSEVTVYKGRKLT